MTEEVLDAAPPSLLPLILVLHGQIPIDPIRSFGGSQEVEGRVAERYRRLGS
jgi:hypothetical protein